MPAMGKKTVHEVFNVCYLCYPTPRAVREFVMGWREPRWRIKGNILVTTLLGTEVVPFEAEKELIIVVE